MEETKVSENIEKRKLTNMELVSGSSGIWQHAGEEPENDVVYVTENDRDLSEIFEVEMDQASLKKVEDGYELTLYDKDNEKVYSEIYPMPEASVKLPVLNEVSKDLVRN